MSEPGGCGGGACGCAGGHHAGAAIAAPPARINGIALHPAGQRPDDGALRELAWAELLRQEAVRQGLLPGQADGPAPTLQPREREVIEAMLERSVPVPQPPRTNAGATTTRAKTTLSMGAWPRCVTSCSP